MVMLYNYFSVFFIKFIHYSKTPANILKDEKDLFEKEIIARDYHNFMHQKN